MRVILLTFLLVLSTFISAQDRREGKLAILLSIDGLRGDLLDRYDKALTGGLRRMKDEGYSFSSAWVDHGITVSHAGHVTLATGMLPKHHGIVDAAFYERKNSGDYVFTDAFQDTSFTLINRKERSISTEKVLVTGISEWIKENDPSARTLSIGTGNISSALYAYRPGSEVYWYNANAGGYVSSTFFQSEYPGWVQRFNGIALHDIRRKAAVWKNSVPKNLRHLAYADSTGYESRGNGGSFPHEMEKELGFIRDTAMALNVWLSATPFSDIGTLLLAEAGIEDLELGVRGSTDLLTIVLSQVDNTAHYYGPFSQESFDAILRIDRAIGEFFSFLDRKVGKGNYLVALSSDHGFPDIPEISAGKGLDARRITAEEIENVMSQVNELKSGTQRGDNLNQPVKEILIRTGFVSEVYFPETLNSSAKPDKFLSLFRNSYRSDRVPRLPFFSLKNFQSGLAELGIMVRLKENYFIDLDVCIHGSAYDYDRHVPLMFFGSGVKKGSSNEEVHTVDVAPTLARLAGLAKIPKVDGRVILN